MAGKPGEYSGLNTEINGDGYSGMKFITKVAPQKDFESWIKSATASNNILDTLAYNKLSQPSQNNPPENYSAVDQNLYNSIMQKYMGPPSILMDH